MEDDKIANMYNNEGLSLRQIGEKLGISRSTVQRKLTNNGWQYDKNKSKYININKKNENLQTSAKVDEENSDSRNLKIKESDSRTMVENNDIEIKTVSRTYAISEQIDRAIKIKAAIEGKKPIDIVREALNKYIEDKYMKM